MIMIEDHDHAWLIMTPAGWPCTPWITCRTRRGIAV